MNKNIHSDRQKLTLIIPAYNRGDLIGETLESALSQTIPFAEIIVVDDGSTDNTQAVLAPYADRVSIIRTQNKGVQSARNSGVAAGRTELAALLDSDDLLESNYVETATAWMTKRPDIDILYCNFITFDAHRSYADKFSMAPIDLLDGAHQEGDFHSAIPELFKRLLSYQPLFPTGSVFRKSFYDRIGGYSPSFRGVGSEDLEFLLRAICLGKVAVCIKPLTRIRKHPGNESRSNLRQVLGESLILEYSLINHPNAGLYRSEILASINERRLRAFDMAFAEGEFNDAIGILKKVAKKPVGLKFLLKCCIAKAPDRLRKSLWTISQRQSHSS